MNVNKEIFDLYIESGVIDKPIVEIVSYYNNLSYEFKESYKSYMLEDKIVSMIDKSNSFSPSDAKTHRCCRNAIKFMDDFVQSVISLEHSSIDIIKMSKAIAIDEVEKNAIIQIIKNCRIIVRTMMDQTKKFYDIYCRYIDKELV